MMNKFVKETISKNRNNIHTKLKEELGIDAYEANMALIRSTVKQSLVKDTIALVEEWIVEKALETLLNSIPLEDSELEWAEAILDSGICPDKDEIKVRASSYGCNLNKQKSAYNMIQDYKEHLTCKGFNKEGE